MFYLTLYIFLQLIVIMCYYLLLKYFPFFSEARHLASKFNCKYIETSATLNIKVDKLILGILKQIKIKLQPEIKESCELSTKQVKKRGSIELLNRLFHLKHKVKVNSDDVFAL